MIEKYKYDAFGEPIVYSGTGAQLGATAYNNRFLFTGREYSNTFGFYEYRARAYHPALGRFMSEDPKGFDAGDYNLFRYCGNDPEDRVDPMGLISVPQEMEKRSEDRLWAMTKFFDRSNIFQGTFAQFTAPQGLLVARTAHWEITGRSRAVKHVIDPATGEIKKDGKGKEVGALTTSKLWVTTRRVQDGLAMTIHLKFDIQYATEAGPITRQFSYDHEHENFDMVREGTYSSSNQLNAVRLLGTSFDTRVAAAQAFDNAVRPAYNAAVGQAYAAHDSPLGTHHTGVEFDQ